MKNTLPFVLFLMTFEITGLNAQVRIGGLTQPNKATVLDLNASDATNDGSKGLALPRVSLADTLALLNGTVPPDGVMVYNTNTVLGEGVYVWSSDKWSQVIMPLRADSGQYMQYNGTKWVPVTVGVVTRTLDPYEFYIDPLNPHNYIPPSFTPDSLGFGTEEIALCDCPNILDMVPAHGEMNLGDNISWTMWSVYFENHRDSILSIIEQPSGKIIKTHFDIYTMMYRVRATINNGRKIWWWGSLPSWYQDPGVLTFRCLKF